MSTVKHGCENSYRAEVLDFSYSVNPAGMPEGVQEAISGAIDEISRYPDRGQAGVKSAASGYYGVSPENIYVTNGASEAIYSLMRAIDRDKEILLAAPLFNEYKSAAVAAGIKCSEYCGSRELNYVAGEDILSEINDDTGAVIICNPSNPSGNLTSVHLLYKILCRCVLCKAYLVLDECFIDLYDEGECGSMLSYIKEYPNLVVIRALTKGFAMPGIRVGFVITSDRELLKRIDINIPPWNISSLAQTAAEYVLTEGENYSPLTYLSYSRTLIARERKRISDALKSRCQVCDSSVNYILFETDADIGSCFRAHGIIIRDCADFTGLNKGFFRVAVRNEMENERLIKIWQRL